MRAVKTFRQQQLVENGKDGIYNKLYGENPLDLRHNELNQQRISSLVIIGLRP